MTTRIALLTLVATSLLLAQAPTEAERENPPVVTFVAPAYPSAAKALRIMGTVVARIAVNRAGAVTEVKSVSGHPLFEDYVVRALKQWRFKPSETEHTFQITFLFEFTTECEGTDKHPIPSETQVSAELPNLVHIKTGLQCCGNFGQRDATLKKGDLRDATRSNPSTSA